VYQACIQSAMFAQGGLSLHDALPISERPEWSLSGLFSFTPTDRLILSLKPRYQGPEWAYAPTTLARMVDANGNRVVEDVNFGDRSEEHTSELQSRESLVCRLLLEKKK